MDENLRPWLDEYLAAVTTQFGKRVLFVGLQGSYARDEATEASDIDMVLVLDTVTVTDLKLYDAAVSGLPQREKLCGFISGQDEIACWSKPDLFQFYHDTTPLVGDLGSLLPQIGETDVRSAILMGACNLYHICGHNLLHGKSTKTLGSLYKAAIFVIQALHFHRTGTYIRKRAELLEAVPPREQALLSTCAKLRGAGLNQKIDLDALSELLFSWASGVVREYGPAQP